MAAPVVAAPHSVDDGNTIRWEGRGVKAPAVAARLLDLRQSASDEEGFPLARASVMNLLVFAIDGDRIPLAVDTVDQLAIRHPSRAIVIATSPGKRFSIDADVAIHRHPLASHGLIYERVVLHAHGADPTGMDTLVIPLLIPHLQSFLWWLGDPDPANPGLRSLAQICDRLIIDSRVGPAQRLADVSLELGPTSALGSRGEGLSFGRLVIGDANWTRLDAFRQGLAGIFDEGHRAEYLEGVTALEVTGTRGIHQPISAAEVLMAGWMSSRLGCEAPVWAPGGVTLRQGGGKRRVSFGFAGTRSGLGATDRAPLRSVRLEAELGKRQLRVELLAERNGGVVRVSETGHPPVRRTIPLMHPGETEALSRELARIGRDRVYEDAMIAAARILAALSG